MGRIMKIISEGVHWTALIAWDITCQECGADDVVHLCQCEEEEE